MQKDYKFKLLLVDDSAFFRDILVKMINKNFKVDIFQAATAFEALRLLGNHKIDLILLDVNLPDVDGYKMSRILKQQNNFTNIPIIYVTGNPPTKENLNYGFESGGIDYLAKPFTEQELVRMLNLYFRFLLREKEVNKAIIENHDKLTKEIEERRAIEQALKESEEKFRKISSSANDGIIMMDAQGLISFWNKAAESILGYTAEEALSKKLHRFIVPERFYEQYKKGFETFKHTGMGVAVGKTLELSALHKDGREIPVEISISGVKIREFWHSIGIVRDITERKAAEIALEKSREMLAQAQKTAHIGNWEYDVVSGVTEWSEELYNILGADKNVTNIKYEDSFKYIAPECRDKVKAAIDSAIENRKTYSVEFQIPTSGGIKFAEGKGIAKFNDKSELVKIFGSVMDITERKIAQIAIEKTAKELKEANATKDKFFSIIAHDLRNPFGGLKNLIALLDEMYSTLTEEDKVELIAEMRKSSEGVFALLENLLTWSRSQRGIIEFYSVPVDVNLIVENCIGILSVNIEHKSLKVVNAVPKEFVINADANMLTTVLRNLISNAIKFTPETGNISITGDFVDGSARICVKDTGVGISEADLQKLFRTDVSHTTIGTGEEKGTGLGLILCEEFVEKHKGKIWAESELGTGSSFIFEIPVFSLDF